MLSSCKSALGRPSENGFNIDVFDKIIWYFIEALYPIKSSCPTLSLSLEKFFSFVCHIFLIVFKTFSTFKCVF